MAEDKYDLSTWPGSAVHQTAVIGSGVRIGKDVAIEAYAVIGDGTTIKDGVHVYQGAVIGREPRGLSGSDSYNMPVWIGNDAIIGAGATLYEGVTIGPRCLIGDGARIRERSFIDAGSIVGSNCTFQNDVRMGQRSRVIDLSHITAGVQIGDDAFVSTGVLTMNDNSFNHGGVLTPPVIANGASVGGGAVLLPGVYVGEDAIVAAGAVVTKYVDAKTTVYGVPAKRRYPQPVNESMRDELGHGQS